MISPPRSNRFTGGPILQGQRFPLWLALLALLVAGLAFSEAVDEDPYVYPEPVGTRIDEPLRVILVIDDSGSTESTDPGNQRYEAARTMIDFLETLGLPDRPDVVQIVHFTSSALADPPHRIGSTDALHLTPRGFDGGTSILAGIIEATRLASQPFDGKTVAVLFTDGQVGVDELDIVASRVNQLSATSFHLVGLGRSRELDTLEQASFASITHVGSMDEGQLKDVFGRIAVEELGLSWGSRWNAYWTSKRIKWATRIDKIVDGMPWT